MERRRAIERTGALLALLVGLVGAACSREPRVNVLLISIDTLRADHLHCYGYEPETSPRIDALAKEGVLFENAVSSTSWTLPAHLTMLSGLPISAHSVCEERLYDRHDAHDVRIPPPLRGNLVSEPLSAAGYRTAGFYSWKYLDDSFGFDAGFDVWERRGLDLFSHPTLGLEFGRLRKAKDVEGMKAMLAAYPELVDPKRRTSPEVVDSAIEWLDGTRSGGDAPFFLFVHLFDVHAPYKPPEGFDRFGPKPSDPASDEPVVPREHLRRQIGLYDGGIAYVDSQVGRLLDHLDQLGLAENTLVILTADHGEEFMEHGALGHRQQLYRESIGVPLILRQKGEFTAGRRVAETVGLVDIVPTILAATKVEPLHALPGADLGAIARGEAGPKERVYTSELFVFAGNEVAYRQVALARGSEHTLVTFCADDFWRGETYDWKIDAHELAAPRTFDSRGEYGRGVRAQLLRTARAYRRLRDGLPQRGQGLRELDEVELKQLKALGYTGLSEAETPTIDSDRTCMEGCLWGPPTAEPLSDDGR
ncbi:MAG: sulfatase [Planctomycetes bacterium]|nr:sulfatase [Planctomycetota bacterium]